MEIMLLLIGLVSGCFVTYLFLRTKLIATKALDTATEERNKIIQIECEQLQQKIQELTTEVAQTSAKRNEIVSGIQLLQAQAEETEKTLLAAATRTAEANFELSTKEMAEKYSQAEVESQTEYEVLLADLAEIAQEKIAEQNERLEAQEIQIKAGEELLAKLKDLAADAVEANKRALAEKTQKDFYRIQLAPMAIIDVEKLRSIAPMLSNREPLDKVIWKTWYEKPTGDLFARVLGVNNKMGIYKITNLENGMCYIGQSVDIATRWKAHIKAGLGIDSSNNKLYTAMKAEGVENFTFEVLEECDRAQLNEQEKYWINYFQSESYGYNSTKGNG